MAQDDTPPPSPNPSEESESSSEEILNFLDEPAPPGVFSSDTEESEEESEVGDLTGTSIWPQGSIGVGRETSEAETEVKEDSETEVKEDSETEETFEAIEHDPKRTLITSIPMENEEDSESEDISRQDESISSYPKDSVPTEITKPLTRSQIPKTNTGKSEVKPKTRSKTPKTKTEGSKPPNKTKTTPKPKTMPKPKTKSSKPKPKTSPKTNQDKVPTFESLKVSKPPPMPWLTGLNGKYQNPSPEQKQRYVEYLLELNGKLSGTYPEKTRVLNELGVKTLRGRPWSPRNYSSFVQEYGK